MLSNLLNSIKGGQQALIDLAPTTLNDDTHHAMLNLNGLTDNQGGLQVTANTEITITGNENRSTGYQWEITDNSCGAKLSQLSDDYNKEANSGMMGAGGERVWKFQTLGEDANYIRGRPCDLTFVYKRPWLKEADNASDRKVVTVTLN